MSGRCRTASHPVGRQDYGRPRKFAFSKIGSAKARKHHHRQRWVIYAKLTAMDRALTRTAAETVPPNCLVQTVADVMRREPALEAVKIDRAQRSVSLATLGQPNPDLERVVTEQIRELQASAPGCRFLEGDADCNICNLSFEPLLQKTLTIKQDAASTTIARVTCPTAPRFWKWSAFPFPKIVPREVHVEDAETHAHEWRQQLVMASLCGVCALAAWLLGGAWSVPLFLAAYLFGSWFTAQEVWEHLREG